MDIKTKLSIILPVYNEDRILRSNVQKLKALLDKMDLGYEILICDDHSDDRTKQEALSCSKEDPRIVYLRYDKRIGKGGTIKNAAKVASGDLLILMDTDVPVSYRDLRKILEQVEGAKLVIAVRRSRPTTSVARKVLSIGYNALVRLLFRTGIMDHQCGLKVLTMDFARKAFPEIRSDGFLFDTELIVHAKRSKVSMKNVWVDWVENRSWGASKIIPFRAMLTLVADLAILRISQIMGKKLLTYKEVATGKFMNHRSNKVYEAMGLTVNVKNQSLLEIIRKIYLGMAFGRGR
ncbi:MAG: glycosyltransferase [archaeon]|nr:glycosyltransferase [archaeon]MCP8314351.1 glycosyltransferase [archaeon]